MMTPHLEWMFDRRVARIDRLYLDRLMRTRGADEGIRAFLEKRAPRW